jgi:type II secretory pathway pseudopilin PulG
VALVPPNLQRYLPIMLVVMVLLFVVPSLLKKKSSSGSSAKTLASQAIDAVNLIDQAEQGYRQTHGRYAGQLADLLPKHPGLAADLAGGAVVTIDAATDGQTYLQQVRNTNLGLVRSRSRGRLIADSCVVLKSASGVSCPS